MSDYFENNCANWFRGTAFPTVPAGVWVALFTTATDDTTGGTEVTGNAYLRVNTGTPGTGIWSAPSGGNGTITNSNVIAFAAATPAQWGTITHFALHDDDGTPTGNRLIHGALTNAKLVGINDVFQFAVGALSITFA